MNRQERTAWIFTAPVLAIIALVFVLPTLLALALSACASTPKSQPISVLAEARQCPAYPLPPTELLKPPVKTDFLPRTR